MAHEFVRWVMEKSPVRGGEHAVLLVLAERARKHTGLAWPAVALIAQEAKVSTRWARQCLRNLERRGLIENRGLNKMGVTKYELKFVEEATGGEKSTNTEFRGGGTPVPGGRKCTSGGEEPQFRQTIREPEGKPEGKPSGGFAPGSQEETTMASAKDIGMKLQDDPTSAKEGKKVPVKKTVLNTLYSIWREEVVAAGHCKFAPAWAQGREFIFAKAFVQKLPPGSAEEVLRHCIHHWWPFVLHVCAANGIPSTSTSLPIMPNMRYLARYGSEAAEFTYAAEVSKVSTTLSTPSKEKPGTMDQKEAEKAFLAELEAMVQGSEG